MLNGLFVIVTLASILVAALTNQMSSLTDAILTSARGAVDLAIGLVGVMAFFLGLMRIATDGGLMTRISRAISPVMRLLFPSVPVESPAMSAMVLNISANMLGLGNAATPFGIKAIQELNLLNSRTGTATNAMVLFLAINTAGLAILPSGMIALRASLGSVDSSGIFLSTWFASGCATIVGITAALLLSRLPHYQTSEPPPITEPDTTTNTETVSTTDAQPPVTSKTRRLFGLTFFFLFAILAISHFSERIHTEDLTITLREMVSYWILPLLVASLLLYGWIHRIRVYESFIEGAKEGFQVAIRIIPYLVAVLVCVGMFRASGALDFLVGLVSPATALIGMPGEALPMAILRPLTGSGAFGFATETMTAHGPDSLIGYMVSTYQGSTETTFYTLAVYFGAIGVKNTRHTVPACLVADIAGILAATFIVNIMFR